MSIEVVDAEERSRYEAHAGGEQVGYLAYHRSDEEDVMVLPHAEVSTEHEGRGIGSALAQAALDDARSKGLRVVPICPFVVAYLERHPEYADLVVD